MISPLKFNAILDPKRSGDIPVAWRPDGSVLRLEEFRANARSLAARLAHSRPASATGTTRWALCFDDASNLATAFLAVLHAGHHIVLPGHTRAALLREQYRAGNFDAVLTDIPLLCTKAAPDNFTALDITAAATPGSTGHVSGLSGGTPLPPTPGNAEEPGETTVSFFTSGSTGQPKCVVKTIAKLQTENDLHTAHWGQRLPATHVVGTTAHHHLYGLQFRVLLPLTLGVPFNATLIEYHEQLLSVPQPFALITSPAFLKRLDKGLPAINQCRHILSAGGFLPADTALCAADRLGIAPFEIYGSTEAGAIAWRDTALERRFWHPLPGVRWEADSDGRLSLRSPFLPDEAPLLVTDDQVSPAPDGAFELLGRLDRILKIEEKRIALPDVEARLRALEGITDAAVVPLKNAAGTRTFLGAVLVPDEAGLKHYAAIGHGRFLVELRQRLRPVLEPVAIPRQFKLVARIPENTQGKRDAAQMQYLFAPVLPQELLRERNGDSITLRFDLQPELLWFKGHFDNRPILPGVTQLHWAIQYAAEMPAPGLLFRRIEMIKFRNPLCPGDRVDLALRWDAATSLLHFTYSRSGEVASSGKVRFAPS
ncbi:MAG: AMP-binding protein [Puniceicoccales bacterium]|jgi:acyl-coenzyme A synthetase/AMP-(fatty) acid ligase|nr:AMP-binding protein [Puniceicoccales bacterium]